MLIDAAPTAPDDHAREAALGAAAGQGTGRLAELGAWIAACQGHFPPRALQRCRVVVFAGDHGVAQRGVSSLPPEHSVECAAEIEAGDGAANVLARVAGASIRVVDISLDHEAWGEERVARSTGSIDVEDAMDAEQFSRAVEIGRRVADQEIDSGADLLIPGDLGAGNTTVAAAVLGAFSGTEPVAVVGPGAGLDTERWKIKVEAIRDAMFRVRGLSDDPEEVLRRIGSPDLVALTAFIAQAAARRTPVLLDGAPVTVAAYLAERFSPGTRAWCQAGQLSPEPAHLIALQALELTPLVALDMNAGQGAGALAALPLLRAAADLLAD
ncbi:MAG: nicotinate-nucleotide--dimethylbenzimidazole phosphoribosyltransferase [Corynebacterium sp.]|uniref:nicotinate-nucleotide--dimethylbenzimidazole phosphoribosyltransferase n=1 Tax=Corynebacterium sp. TaxID=1720 RepID=UPI0026E0B3EA|nr:nicotinate-nucleotide--dimethylbenzimidazole phosphoribosyltransferase [Corynebacterium sp.]MDO5669094.1 nicotinate-nucleotide--dimethylbenzimidazole phosphoribosyltransferase [Corynebacterium sp.]